MKIETVRIETRVTVNPMLPSEKLFGCAHMITADELTGVKFKEELMRYIAEKLGREFDKTMAKEGYEL